MRSLFVYGSLTRPATLDAVLGRRFAGERLRATLHGYARCTAEGYAWPFLVEHADTRTEGVLLLDLSDEDLDRLDAYEDVAAGTYVRTDVEVDAHGCGPVSSRVAAQTYVAGPRLLALDAFSGG